MILRKYLLPISLLASGAIAVAPVSATIVFSDDFANNDRTTDPAWYTIGNPAGYDITEQNGILSLGSTSTNQHRALSSSWEIGPNGGYTLSVGDELTFSFTAKLTGNQGNRNNEFQFGIGNNMGDVPAADGETAVFENDRGYIVALGAGSGATGILRDAGTQGFLGRPGSGDHTTLVSETGMALTQTFTTYSMTISRTSTGLDLTLTDGNFTISGSDNSVPGNEFYTFNTMTFGYYNRNTENSIDIDSITVIPEPTTYAAIFGLGALGLVMLRRCLRA